MRSPVPQYLPLFVAALFALAALPGLADTSDTRSSEPKRVESARTERPARESLSDPESDAVRRVIELTNNERARAGLPPLKRHPGLLSAADWMARDMSARFYFEHRDSKRRELAARINDFQYGNYHCVGENIALGPRSPEEVVTCWMNSPGHRANILSTEFCEIGVGYVPPSEHNAYGFWVEDFGSRFNTFPVVINNDARTTGTARVKLAIYGKGWAEQMRISNDGATWTDWTDYEPRRDWTLASGVGVRTVYVELRRSARVQRVEAAIAVEAPQPPDRSVARTTPQ